MRQKGEGSPERHLSSQKVSNPLGSQGIARRAMRKLLWAGGAAVVLLLIGLLGLTLFVKSYLTSEKLKAIIIPKLEAVTGRSVSIGDIDVSIFRGVVVKEISIRELTGNNNFISVKEFILNYRLLPLLRRQLIIDKLELDSPHIWIEREKDSTYNFSDITAKKAERQPKAKEPIPFALVADSIRMHDTTLAFTDRQKKLPDVAADIPDITLKTAVGRIPGEITLTGHISIRSGKAVLNGIPTDTSGSVDITDRDIVIAFTTMLGNDSVKTSGSVINYHSAPDARINIYAKQLDLDRLIPAANVKRADTVKNSISPNFSFGGYQFRIYRVRDVREPGINASGQIRIDAMHYSGYDVKDFFVGYRYERGAVTLSPMQMALAGGRKINATGTVKGGLAFSYGLESEGTSEAIKRTLAGKGFIDLKNVEVKSSAIMEAISLLTGINELRTPKFDTARFALVIRNQKTSVNGSMDSRLIVLNPSGTVGFDKKIDMTADLKLSPALSSRLSGSQAIGYFKDKEGWTIVPLKITGTADRPSVGINTSGLGKRLQKGVEREIKKRFFENLLPK